MDKTKKIEILNKISNELNDILYADSEKDAKKTMKKSSLKSPYDVQSAIYVYNDLVKYGLATFINENVKTFFAKYIKVEEDGIGYKINILLDI